MSLRKASAELQTAGFTMERTGRRKAMELVLKAIRRATLETESGSVDALLLYLAGAAYPWLMNLVSMRYVMRQILSAVRSH